MTDFVAFEATVEPMVWGRATYTVFRVPEAVVSALGPTRRVEGEIAEHPVNLALSRAPVFDGVFLWAGQSLLDRIGITSNEMVELRLRPAADDLVDLPDDIGHALIGHGVLTVWESLSPGKRRGMIYQVTSAKTDATRQKRIAKLLQGLIE